MSREEAAIYKALVEQSLDAMFVLDEHLLVRCVNPAMLQLLGLPRAASLAGAPCEFIDPEDRAMFGELCRGHVKLLRPLRWRRADGATVHVQARATEVYFDDIAHVVVVGRDVTSLVMQERQRKTTEAALRISEERYRLLFDASPLPIWVLDPATLKHLAVNEALVRLYGFSREELLETSMRTLRADDGTDRVDVEMARTTVGNTHHMGVRRHRCKDGRIVELDITAHAMMLEGSLALLAIGVDVTRSRKVEELLRQSQKLEAIGQLAGGIAHDFNNILAAILGNADLVLETIGDDHPVTTEIREIEAVAQRGADLTRQLLTFSRKQHREVKVLALDEIVGGLEKMLRRIVREDIEMSTRLGAQLAAIVGDPSQVEQLVMNLVVNARDAMPEGGKLSIETANVVLDEAQAVGVGVKPGRYVHLSVADTDHGMDEWTRDRIFEPFFTTKDVGKGTGLGLSMVFGIVKQSEGAIVVESEPRRGATFHIYLPAVEAEAIPLAPRTRTRKPEADAKTILLVEDDDMLRAVIRRRLQSWGYRLFEAANAEAALAWLRDTRERVDLLLTDLVMPGEDGRALARQVVAQHHDVKVLFMSGYSEHCAIKTAVFGPDDHFIPKPFTANHLARALMRVLGGDWLERHHA